MAQLLSNQDMLLVKSSLEALTRAYEDSGKLIQHSPSEHFKYLKQKALIGLITKSLS